jgi:spore maturation protein CgeB
MQDCRISLNLSHTGTQAAKQVKGRVVEAALAGSCLLELANSPTRDWFEPGVDFLEYQRPGDAIETIQHYAKHPEQTEAIARRLREKVLAQHGPQHFWGRILDRLAIKV